MLEMESTKEEQANQCKVSPKEDDDLHQTWTIHLASLDEGSLFFVGCSSRMSVV